MAVDGGAPGERTAGDGNTHFAAGALSALHNRRQTGAGCSGEIGFEMRRDGVGVDGDFVGGGESSRDDAECIIDALHVVSRQALIDQESDRQWKRVYGEKRETLALSLFIHF